MFHRIPKDHIDLIIDQINLSNIKFDSLYLYGSFAINEGACVEFEESFYPYNDYDVLLISDDSVSEKKIKTIEEDLTLKLNIKWFDITQIKKTQIKDFKSSIKNFDIVYGSKLLKGKDLLSSECIDIESNKIGINDIFTLFETRIYCLVSVIEIFTRSEKSISHEDKIFINYQLSKAILATIDATLVNEKIFSLGYLNKSKIFIQTRDIDKKFLRLIDWALEQKFRPNISQPESHELCDFFEHVKDLYFKTFQNIFSQHYKKIISSESELADFILKNCKNNIKRIYRNYRYGDNYGNKRLYLLIIQIKICFCLDKNYKSNIEIIEIENLLEKFFGLKFNNDLHSIIVATMNLRMSL